MTNALPAIEVNLGAYQAAVDAALTDIKTQNIMQRIWDHDHTVWKEDPTEISNRLGWLHMPASMPEHLGKIQELVNTVQTEGYTTAVVLGMGGSSLAPEVFARTFGNPNDDYLELLILDSTDADRVQEYTDRVNLAHTLFIVATKSGGTVETLSFFKYFYNQVVDAVGQDAAGSHFVAITDPGSKLETLAAQYYFRATFLNDPTIGGRYSALSFFGLVPAALVGADLSTLLTRGATAADNAATVDNNQAAKLGAILGELAKAGRDKVTFITSEAIAGFGDWVEQLIAESTGKDGVGILPVVGEAVGQTAVYGGDRLFVFMALADDDSLTAAVTMLVEAGHPVVSIQLSDAYDLGGQYFLWEMATAVAGQRLGIQPFDQPNVESAKVRARQMVAAYEKTGTLPAGEAASATANTLHNFLTQAQVGDYIALQAYVHPTPEVEAVLQTLRIQLRDQYKVATTLGYGPRFLHSTGQLHKGDGGNGLFIQFTSDPNNDVAIPNTASKPASDMSFGTLKLAQALGDGQALQDANRRVIRFHLGTAVVPSLQQFTA